VRTLLGLEDNTMKCGYKYKTDNGEIVHIVCNKSKQWYRRTFKRGSEARWQKISPPTIIDGHLKHGGDSIKVAVLQNCPVNFPNN